MARVCQITGKKPLTGYHVSKSNRKTKRRFLPNLIKKRFFVPETGQWMTLRVSTSALRTINKKGLYNCLKELEDKGELKLN
ncbi:MAG: 50S ribosomal protein L28 [Chitinophagales bacterium]|nr:MAG: 50S ribosomal protein L28 [Chitinophagales bacterium]